MSREPVPMLCCPFATDLINSPERKGKRLISRPVLEMATAGGDSETGDAAAAAATVLAEVVSEEQVIA